MVPAVLARTSRTAIGTAVGVVALGGLAAVLVSWQAVAAPTSERVLPPPPLTVSAEEQDGYIALHLANVGSKEIAGYAIVLKLREPNRPRGLKAVHTMLVGPPGDSASPKRRPGESWTDQTATFKRRGSDRSKRLMIVPTIDYVLFSDGRGWGLDAERRSLFLAGMRSGATNGIQHLVTVLREQGAHALGQEVERLAQRAPTATPVGTTERARAASQSR